MVFVFFNETVAARRRVYFQLVAGDGITPVDTENGLQPQISTNGGAFTNTGISVLTFISHGRYYADLTQGAVATTGDSIETRYGNSGITAECPGDSVRVVGFNPYDNVHLGITGLPNAVAGASGGLPLGNGSGQVTVGGITTGVIQGIFDFATSLLTTAGSFGKMMVDLFARVGTPSGASLAADVATANSGINGIGTIVTEIAGDTDTIISKTNLIPGSPAAVGSAMALGSGAITAATFATDAIDANALAATAATEIANAVGAFAIESGLTFLQAMRLAEAVLSGKSVVSDVMGGKQVVYYRKDGTTIALTVQYDTSGNRTSIAYGTL